MSDNSSYVTFYGTAAGSQGNNYAPALPNLIDCMICLDHSDDTLRMLQCCRQAIHQSCLTIWQQQTSNKSCPHCRTDQAKTINLNVGLYHTLTTLYPADPEGIMHWMFNNPNKGFQSFAKGYYSEKDYYSLFSEVSKFQK